MRINPRNAVLALFTAGTLLTGVAACGSHSDPAPAPQPIEVDDHDCDYGDLLENDSDCKGYLGSQALTKYCKDKAKRAKLGHKCDRYVTPTKRASTKPPAHSLPRLATPTKSVKTTAVIPPIARPRTAVVAPAPAQPRATQAPARPAPLKPATTRRR